MIEKMTVRACLLSSLVIPGLCLAGPAYITDFDAGLQVPKLTAAASPAGTTAVADIAPVGTIDVSGSKTPSSAVRLVVKNSGAADWTGSAVVGPQAVQISETDLRKITLSFMASVSTLQPVTVKIDSVDADGQTTGSATGEVYPAAPNFYQRFALDLSSLKSGDKPFDPKSPQVKISFGVKAEPGLPKVGAYELRVDNLALSAPGFYVSPTGNDGADGKTEATAFATPQRAVELAGPGDVILLKGGTYNGTGDAVKFVRPGTPAGWIVLKNAPGETPVLTSTGWSIVRIGLGSKEAVDTGPGIAYIEVRGLNALGTSSVDASGNPVSPHPELLGKAVAETNGNGILIEGRNSKNTVHHIRIADCVIDRCAGVGAGAIYSDWIYYENNITRDNSWFTNYATSGFSILLGSAFDGTAGGYRLLVSGNRSSGNRCYQKWTASSSGDAPKKLSDGNGIIIDTLGGSAVNKNEPRPPFTGRTLVVNNISFNNGGSGIHLVSSPNVDLVNNTTYLNGQTPETKYSQMFGYRSPGSNYINNIIVAPEDQRYNTSSSYGEAGNTDVIWSHNLYFGAKAAPRTGGIAEIIKDPMFVRPSTDPKVADFTLKPESPALTAGARTGVPVPIPLVDIDGHRRPMDINPSIGASQP